MGTGGKNANPRGRKADDGDDDDDEDDEGASYAGDAQADFGAAVRAEMKRNGGNRSRAVSVSLQSRPGAA